MAILRVIDAASHQGEMNQSAMEFDALIVKATEGTTYVNPYCDGEFQKALKLGKKLGVYHFARNASGNTADAEANFFIQNTRGYIGKAIPVLDWEDSDQSDVAWALQWLQLVEKAYGCKPLIYMSESVVNSYDWSKAAAGNYGLWCAKYADYVPDYNWDMAGAGAAPSVKWWSTMALWQWTSVGRLNGHSGNLDCSVFYGDGAAWDKYVGGSGQQGGTAPVPSNPAADSGPAGSVLDLVYHTMKGTYGDGETRRKKLGSRYEEVQGVIDHIASAPVETLAAETLQGTYGNGTIRETVLSSKYDAVQRRINDSQSGGTGYYTVQSGDTLSGIGSKLGVNWQRIAAANGIGSPYTIYPGQRLRVK